jgi:hypothetical protein
MTLLTISLCTWQPLSTSSLRWSNHLKSFTQRLTLTPFQTKSNLLSLLFTSINLSKITNNYWISFYSQGRR